MQGDNSNLIAYYIAIYKLTREFYRYQYLYPQYGEHW